MRLDLRGLGIAGLDLDLTGDDGRPTRVRLGPGRGASGTVIGGPPGTSLRGVAIDEVTLAGLAWPVDDTGGQLAVDGDAVLERLTCDGELPADGSGFFGRLAVHRIRRALAIAIGGVRLGGELHADEVGLENGSGGGHVAATALELTGAAGHVGADDGGIGMAAARLVLDRPRCDWSERGTLVSFARGSLACLALRRPGLAVDAPQVELPAGVLTSAGAFVVPELVIPELTIEIADVLALFAAAPAADADVDAAAARPAVVPPARPPDLGFLDRVGGQLDVDVTADIALPVIGNRRATHRFRVPIADGTFNYKDLENDLARLEDAFIDIEVRERSLAIERRIPMVPGSEKPLVLFDLADDEIALARRRYAKLKALARIRFPGQPAGEPPSTSSSGGSPIALNRLDFAIDAALDLAPPTDDRPDLALRASAAVIRATGAIHFVPDRTVEPGRGVVTVEGLAAGPARQLLGGLDLGFDRLTCARLDLELELDGFKPRAARLVLRDLAIANLRLA